METSWGVDCSGLSPPVIEVVWFSHLPVVGKASFWFEVQTLPATEPARTEGGEILFVFTVSVSVVAMLYI
jgi:hypothetical protein